MVKRHAIIAAAAFLGLAGCLETDLSRGLAGAAVGAAAADPLGTDETATALAGASVALFCDDAGICTPTRN